MTEVLAPTGLVIGRFIPPHSGHDHLIDRSAAQVGRLVVMVNGGPRDDIPGELRAGWLRAEHPNVNVVHVRHELETDFNDLELWNKWVALFQSYWPLDRGPDVVFSSEPYGAELARRLGARSVVVDADRASVPVSGTMIRANPAAYLDYLAPAVRAWVQANWC